MRHHIVAIGISRHQSSFVHNLGYAAKDAVEFFNLFRTNIESVGYQKLLIDSEATLSQIRTALGSKLLTEVEEDDAFFFFYSGHGTTAEDTDNESLAHFLLPFDATTDITSSCISVSFLRETFDRLPCQAKLIFVDSCFSGSINSKGYTNPTRKAFKQTKTLASVVVGTGELSFSASKEDEEAIEDPEAEHGLFTYCLLNELQRKRKDEKFAILDAFTPVTETVMKRAKEKYDHTQTPTLSSHLEGNIYLPVFRKRIKLTPQILDIPKYRELSSAAYPIPELELKDKQQQKIVNDMIDFVVKGRLAQRIPGEETVQDLIFDRFCGKVLRQTSRDWDRIFTENRDDVSKIPDSVAKLEAASFQFVLLGAVTAVFGSKRQMTGYSQYAGKILEMTRGRSGLVPLIAAPEVVLAEIVYVVGTISLARNDIRPLSILLHTRVTDPSNIDGPPQPLVSYKDIHYCHALGGHSTKVNDHIRQVLSSLSWLPELAPELEGKVDDSQREVNFLLVMLTRHHEKRLWPDFARGGRWSIMPLIRRIKYDAEFKKQLAEMFEVESQEIRGLFMKYLKEIKKEGLGSRFWDSIDVSDLLTEEERRAEQGEQR